MPCPFDLKQLQLIPSSGSSPPPSGVYFVVVEEKAFKLYENESKEQLYGEIPLDKQTNCNLHPPYPDVNPDEMMAKELPIRLQRNKHSLYLYAASNNEKEDWLIAIKRVISAGDPPRYDKQAERAMRTDYFASLDPDLDWMNAFLARMLYHQISSKPVQEAMKIKFIRRLAMSPIPGFIGGLDIRSIGLGLTPPRISDPRLLFLNSRGEMMINLTIQYDAPVDRAVMMCVQTRTILFGLSLPLMVTIHVLEVKGTVQLWLKEPDKSDRLWFAFTERPLLRLNMSTDSVGLNSTMKPILRLALEKALTDAICDGMMVPNYSDAIIPPMTYGDTIIVDH